MSTVVMTEPYYSKVTISDANSFRNIWWCELKKEWHWSLIWEDGSGSYGTHMHSGIAASEEVALSDLSKTIAWIESKWPSEEYFNGGGG